MPPRFRKPTETAATTLARYAAQLDFDAIPQLDIDRAKQCLIDTVGVALLGGRMPWGRMIADYARHYGGAGTSMMIGESARVAAPMAALANGVFAHGFEYDSLRKPGAGVHPGAALVPPALALAEELGANGRAVLTALVAGCEVMFRIGVATRHTSEHLGFHAPGLTGPFGSTVTASHLLGLDGERMCHALGIAGSLCGGLLAFVKGGNGSMVKRLHLGRAAEAGILAARLAAQGFEGPDTILEGEHGFLATYCEEYDAAKLTQGLGQGFEMRNLCLKRYPCHITAHAPLQAIESLRAAHAFEPNDVAGITLRGSAKMQSHHAEREPADTMAAQYSVPFCVAAAIVSDPMDPATFMERGLGDPRIRRLCREIAVERLSGDATARSGWASEVTIRLRDGREMTAAADDFKGTPTIPMSTQEVRDKFLRCAGEYANAVPLLAQLEGIESLSDVRDLELG